VTIHYPFHPYVGQTLPVVARPRHTDGAYTVEDPAGSPLQVPVWMTESTAAHHRLSETPFVAMAALRDVSALLSLHDWSATLLSSHPHEGGQPATTLSVARSPSHPTRAPGKRPSEGGTHGGHEPDRQGVFCTRKGGSIRC
jgi:hypothetical protein